MNEKYSVMAKGTAIHRNSSATDGAVIIRASERVWSVAMPVNSVR